MNKMDIDRMHFDRQIETSDAPPSALRNVGPNVTGVERAVSIAAGAAIAGLGLRSGRLGLGAAALSAALLARGVLRNDPVKRAVSLRPAAKRLAETQGWRSAALTNRAITINRPRAEVYAAWRDFNRLAGVLENIESITENERRTHWVAKAPNGEIVEWDALITDEDPGRRLSWRSVEGSQIQTIGEIRFEDARRGTACAVRASLAYEPPAGQAGRLVATLFQREPVMQMRRDLRRFKQYMETGEISTSKRTRAGAEVQEV